MSAKLKNALMLAPMACALALSACGSEPSGSGDAPKAAKPAPTEAEKLAMLASLPSPYNAGDLENGRRVFARCRSCHTITDGGPNMTGPNLYGVFGNEVGTHQKYRYSEALKSGDFTWDAEKLDHWLERPRDFLPGNKMSFVGIAAEQDRRDVIAFLKVETGYAPAAATTPPAE